MHILAQLFNKYLRIPCPPLLTLCVLGFRVNKSLLSGDYISYGDRDNKQEQNINKYKIHVMLTYIIIMKGRQKIIIKYAMGDSDLDNGPRKMLGNNLFFFFFNRLVWKGFSDKVTLAQISEDLTET